jgi:hypothetical protein
LARFWQDWRSALLIVKPETIIKKHATTLRPQILTRICKKESASGAMNWSNETGEHPDHVSKVVEPTWKLPSIKNNFPVSFCRERNSLSIAEYHGSGLFILRQIAPEVAGPGGFNS